MGELVEMMLEGILCQQCGVALDDMMDPETEAPGYPRFCPSCEPKKAKIYKCPSCPKKFAEVAHQNDHARSTGHQRIG